jgi:IclR family KDG regulon transcriptional repressor
VNKMKESSSSTLERALVLLEQLAAADGKVGVVELADSVNLPKSTTHRILETLTRAQFVERDESTEKYSIGLKAIEIGLLGLRNVDLVDATMPHLKDLVHHTKQTSFLAVYSEGEIIYIYKAEGTSSVITNANLGRRNPVHCTGLGKAIMAYYSLEYVDRIITLKGLKRYTQTTIDDRQQFLQELSSIRQAGFAFNNAEYEEGLSSIAAPIFNYTGQVIAAISVAGPTYRIVENRERIQELILEKSATISKRLGFVPTMRSITM